MLKERPLPEMGYIIEIGLNKEQIESDGEYSYNSIIECIIEPFKQYGFKNMMYNGSLLIYDDRHEDCFSLICGTAVDLYDCEWLRKYLTTYYYYDYNTYDEDGFYDDENLLESIPIAKRRWK